jgi:hypothetical protein
MMREGGILDHGWLSLSAAHRFVVTMVATGLMLMGCNNVQPKVAFDESQRAFASRQVEKGTGEVRGSAFLHAPSGRTYTAGGDWIHLIPATAYAEERMRILYGTLRQRRVTLFAAEPATPDPDYVTLSRREKADMHGRFAFADVRPGRWFVAARVRWEERGEASIVDIYDEVMVKAGEVVEVVLSGN